MYDSLRTLSFRLASGASSIPYTYNALAFPERWKALLQEPFARAIGRDPARTSLPAKALNQALRALVPDLISTTYRPTWSNSKSWLYSTRQIDVRTLHLIVYEWARLILAKAPPAAQAHALESLRVDDLQWAQHTADLAAWRTAANGTAEPRQGEAFYLLPDLLAARLSAPDVALEAGSHSVRLRRAPLPAGQAGAELVSWPPFEYPDSRGRWFWSLAVAISVQTVPFQPFPVIHFDLGVHRWVSRSLQLRGGETSAYLLARVPWLQGLHHSQSFQVAPLAWKRVAQELPGNRPTFRLVWGGRLAPLLDALLTSGHQLPDPQELLEDPAAWLDPARPTTAAVLFSTRIRADHGVGVGLMPVDRRMLAEQISALLAPQFVFTDPAPRRQFKAVKPFNPFFESEGDRETVALRRQSVAAVSAGQLDIEVWHQSEMMQDALVSALCETLGLSRPARLPHAWNTEELRVTVRPCALGALGGALDLNAKPQAGVESCPPAVAHRIEKVHAAAPLSAIRTVALVELDGPEVFNSNTDPKDALRLGFAGAGRLTQFITPASQSDKKLENRALNSLRDLFRQLGIPVEYPQVDGLPADLNYVGVWLVNQTDWLSGRGRLQLPVLVHIASGTGEIRATAPGLAAWLPYPDALLAIGQGRARSIASQHVANYIQQMVKNDVAAQGDTLLLCHAQKMRSVWPWLGNSRLTVDQLAFGYNEAPEPIEHVPGLRVVRVRDGDETPQWYAQKGEDQQGFAQGVFEMGPRVFASTHQKPVQFKRLSPNVSKFAHWTTSRTHKVFPPAPHRQAWNPGLCELTVVCLQPQDSGNAVPWAALAHQLRHAASHYEEATALPWPLHLAQQMAEYTRILQEEEEE